MLLAINRTAKNKVEESDFRRFNGGFENVDLSIAELADEVSQGYAFCPQHRNGWREGKNFICSGVIGVDVDHGLRVEEALAHPFVQQFGGFVYTTVSHTAEAHRFRIVFELEQPITEASCMRHAFTGLISKFGGDKACKDACRLFYGNENATVTHLGKKLPPEEVSKLILRGEEYKLSVSMRRKAKDGDGGKSKKTPKGTVRSRYPIEPDTIVRDKDGIERRLADLPKGVSIHCPVHVDNHPSAFTLISKQGVVGLYCSACAATFFVSPYPGRYDFDYNVDILRGVDTDADEGYGIVFINEQYLPKFDTPADVILVKSPKGTGKTELLKDVVAAAKNDGKSVLLIGHRQALIRSTAQRLGLTPYIDPVTGRAVKPNRHYAICLDSLSTKLTPKIHDYDIVIVDEVEQVLVHLTSDTIAPRRKQSLTHLQYYLRTAKKLYVLDADLNDVTALCISALLSDERGRQKGFLFIVNDWKPQRGITHLYESEAHLWQLLHEHLAAGKRCFVCSNSKKRVDALTLALEMAYSEKAIYSITSDNSREHAAQEFLSNLPKSFLDYDCVLVSPAVGTGVDITFANEESLVDSVFGFFETQTTTHFDMDQQLCRVRHPGSVRVWVSSATYNFETDTEVIRQEIVSSYGKESFVDFDDDGSPEYNKVDLLYADLYADITSMQRGSKNELLENFKNLRAANGWEIVEVATDEEARKEGKELAVLGAELAKEERAQAVCSAPVITLGEYNNLRDKGKQGSLSLKDTHSLRRYEIEEFYRCEVTPWLVETDNDGRFRTAVKLYELIRDSKAHAELTGELSYGNGKDLLLVDEKKIPQLRRLLIDLFSSVPGLFEQGAGFDSKRVLTQDSLQDFVSLCQKRRVIIQRLLHKDVSRDLVKKPMSQLGRFLRSVGLQLESPLTKKDGGKKIYYYTLDDASLADMERIIKARRERKANWRDELGQQDDFRP